MKKFVKIYIGITIFIGFLYAEKGYRIEVVVDTVQKVPYVKFKPKEVKLISPEGEIIRRVPLTSSVRKEGEYWYSEWRDLEDSLNEKGLMLITQGKRRTSYDPRELKDYYVEPGEYWDIEVEVIDNKGQTKFKRNFKTYPGDDPASYYWRGIFSRNGNMVLFYFRDKEGKFNVEVYNIEGKKLADARYDDYLNHLQISFDGKIVGAETGKVINGKWIRHLFFLDVQTKRIKIVKAEGEVNGRKWSVTPDLRENKKIGLSGGWHDIPFAQSVVVTFDELPEDLSTLFKQGGEK